MKEIYMNIGNYQGKDFSNYEVSNLGNVRNAKTKKVLKTRTRVRDNYAEVDVKLSDTNHKKHTIVVARLVISTFKANPDNKPTVNHINEDSTDNRLNNLEWSTYLENNTHNERHLKIASKNKISVKCIELDMVFDSAGDAADWLNEINGRSNITACCKGKQKSAYGYTWKYVDPKKQISVTNKKIYNITDNKIYTNGVEAAKELGLASTYQLYKACRYGNTCGNCQWCFYEDGMEDYDPDYFMFIWD